MSDELPLYRPRCRYLTCKSMLVFGEDFEMDPEYQAGSMDFWCEQTSRCIGPDGEGVSLDECRNPERSCFEEY